MKTVFVTAHNWEGYQQSGFHKVAEAAAKAGKPINVFRYYANFWFSPVLSIKRGLKSILQVFF